MSLTKNLKSITKKCCTIFKTLKVKNYFSLNDETPLALHANVVYLFEGSCDKNKTYIGKTKRHFATRAREQISGNLAICEHISSCNACNHFTIENCHILSHGNNDLNNNNNNNKIIKQKRPCTSRNKNQKNKHLHQHDASFLLNVF